MKWGLKGAISIDAGLGFLGLYFDAAVVFATSQTLLLKLAVAILCFKV